MQRSIYLISVLIIAVLVLTACGGETTMASPQIEQPAEPHEAPEEAIRTTEAPKG